MSTICFVVPIAPITNIALIFFPLFNVPENIYYCSQTIINFSYSFSCLLGVVVTIPQTGWLKQWKFIVSQLWKLEVLDQGAGRVGIF